MLNSYGHPTLNFTNFSCVIIEVWPYDLYLVLYNLKILKAQFLNFLIDELITAKGSYNSFFTIKQNTT